ncbi:hypothetical protein CKO28_21720 [Rhodovibrio sodomensis]|uniref:Transposase DDE domain-containing protein n=1 Tax=Rhodovibrio sodomensis TaxID=1088 RepID=A0ABS1DLM9_9PROT|nr:hypothetical protein [Rhodovibrio sodomensis]
MLRTTGKVLADNTNRCLASMPDCRAYPLKPKCGPNIIHRKVTRDINEDARDDARALACTKTFRQSARKRKKVDICSLTSTGTWASKCLRLRGLSGTTDKFLLAATLQNLSRLAKRLTPPPEPASAM